MAILKGKQDDLPHFYINSVGKLKDDRISDYFIFGFVEVERGEEYGGGKKLLSMVDTEPYVQ